MRLQRVRGPSLVEIHSQKKQKRGDSSSSDSEHEKKKKKEKVCAHVSLLPHST